MPPSLNAVHLESAFMRSGMLNAVGHGDRVVGCRHGDVLGVHHFEIEGDAVAFSRLEAPLATSVSGTKSVSWIWPGITCAAMQLRRPCRLRSSRSD
ncbi:MAG: hypothetical protein ACLTQI_04170 [Slackia sp.]